MEEAEFFVKELEEQIVNFDQESKRHKRMYRYIRYFIFICTGLSTVLAGIAIESGAAQKYLNMTIVVITAALGIASSYEGLRKPSELWIMERNLYHSLTDLKRTFEYGVIKYGGKIDTQAYFDTMQQLLNAAGDKWQKNKNKDVK